MTGLLPIPNDPSAARTNTLLVRNARRSLHFDAKLYFFVIPIHYNPNGGRLTGEGGSTMQLAESQQTGDNNPLFTLGTRFVASNPESGADFLILTGMGQSVERIAFYGRRWPEFRPEPTGPRAKSCIAIEGRSQPPTGRHIIRECGFFQTDFGIRCLATPEETHADLGKSYDCCCSNVGSFFRSENSQAVSWAHYNTFMEEGDTPIILGDIVRGGKCTFYSPRTNGLHISGIRVVDDLAPNCNSYFIYDWQIDRAAPGGYVRYVDTKLKNLRGRIEVNNNNPQFSFDGERLGLECGIEIEGAK